MEKIFTNSHLDIYKNNYDNLIKKCKSAKSQIFMDFFGKNYKTNLKFITEKMEKFGFFYHTHDLDIRDYGVMMREFLYPVFIGNIQNSLNRLEELSSVIQGEINKEFSSEKESMRYKLSKALTKYFDINIRIWGVSYKTENSTKLDNIRYALNKIYTSNDILDGFFTISTSGDYYPDEALLANKVIDEKDFKERTVNKVLKYRKMVIENSIEPNSDIKNSSFFPDALIVCIEKKPDINTIEAESGKNIWEEFNIDRSILNTFCSIDFHYLGIEPLINDSIIALELMNS